MLKSRSVGEVFAKPTDAWTVAAPVALGRRRETGGEFPANSGASRSALRYCFVMPIDDLQQAAQKIAGFLATLNKLGGLRLKYRITAGDAAHDPEGLNRSHINVELAGPDVPLVTQHNGELLRALETISAQILRLDAREQDLVSFDAGNFKALQAQELQMRAQVAAEQVIRSGIPYAFPPTNSRERRLLHMAFKSIEGVETASSGEGPDRFLAVYPKGKTDLPVTSPVKPRGFDRRR
jgi:spoIIIJ-associated protein